MADNDDLRYTKMPLNNGSGAIPALGFGTLDPIGIKEYVSLYDELLRTPERSAKAPGSHWPDASRI